MRFTLALAGAALIASVLPAAAQSDYWVVQNMHTRHCQIVSQRPVGHDMTVIGGNGVTYHTQMDAQTAMRTVKVCHTD